jgi:hypothetical protein
LTSSEAVEVPGAAPFGAIPTLTAVDGRLLYSDESLSEENGGLGTTPYYELTHDGVTPAFVAKGKPYSLLRLR